MERTKHLFFTVPDLMRQLVPVWHRSLLMRDTQNRMRLKVAGTSGSDPNSQLKTGSFFITYQPLPFAAISTSMYTKKPEAEIASGFFVVAFAF